MTDIKICEQSNACSFCVGRDNCEYKDKVKGTRPDSCPIIAMPEECAECVRTRFRSGIKCGEWAKMNGVLNGQDWDIACPMYPFFKEITETE